MRSAQVAVVGGGPAGLSAAIASARVGIHTMLFDEQPIVGGQLRYRIAEVAAGTHGTIWAPLLARRLADEAASAGVELHAGATVWGLFAERTLTVVEGDASYQLKADRIILATGSTDRPLPFPGGTLPGVFTARAVQILLNLHRVLPGRRYVVVGDGVEAAEGAKDIVLAGGEVVARVRTEQAPSLAAEGVDGVEAVTVNGVRYDADVVVLAIGRQPDPELALMADCAVDYAAETGGWIPVRDGRLHTTSPGIFVCGDAAGICDVAVALAEGTYAGSSVAASIGMVDEGALHRARSAYEAVAASRIRIAETLVPSYTQAERVTAEV